MASLFIHTQTGTIPENNRCHAFNMRIMDIDCLIFENCLLLVSIEVENSSFKVKFKTTTIDLMQWTSSPHVTKCLENNFLEDCIQLSVVMQYNYCNDRLLIHVPVLVTVKCVTFSPFFSYALGIIENNGLL